MMMPFWLPFAGVACGMLFGIFLGRVSVSPKIVIRYECLDFMHVWLNGKCQRCGTPEYHE